jgi:hypothetical protein
MWILCCSSVVLHLKKNTLVKVACFSKTYCNAKFQYSALSGAGVVTHSKVFMAAMMMLLILGN